MEKITWMSGVRAINDLKPYEHNPRKITKKELKKLKESLEESGYNAPILIDEDHTIIAGHQRWEVLKELGYEQVDVRFPDRKLSVEEYQRINIQDNVSFGDWDADILNQHFDFDKCLDWGVPEDLRIIDDETKSGLTGDDAVPEVSEVPVSKVGDIYALGNHRLMCGDSTNVDHVKRLLDGQSPNTMITDPPYGVKYNGDFRARVEKGRKNSERDNSGELLNDNRSDWREAYALFPGNIAYVWHADKFTDIIMAGLREAGIEPKQKIIWVKNNHVLGLSDYHPMHEPCWYAVKDGKNRTWKGGRTQKTVWNINSIQYTGDDQTAHPTQKPVEIYSKALEHHTSPGEYVYDPFGGSGTLVIACEKLGRRALTMELDPKFVDLIVKRWEDFTGLKASIVEVTNAS